MRPEHRISTEFIVDETGPLDEEKSELPPPAPEPKKYTTDELIGIYKLLKAGFTAEDFKA